MEECIEENRTQYGDPDRLNINQRFLRQLPPENSLQKNKDQMSAIKKRDGKYIEKSQIQTEKGDKHEERHDPVRCHLP